MHDKYLNRPAFNGGDDEEYAIEILTQEITSVIICTSKFIELVVVFIVMVIVMFILFIVCSNDLAMVITYDNVYGYSYGYNL